MLEVAWLLHVLKLLHQFVVDQNSDDLWAQLLLKHNGSLDALHEGLVRLAPTQITLLLTCRQKYQTDL